MSSWMSVLILAKGPLPVILLASAVRRVLFSSLPLPIRRSLIMSTPSRFGALCADTWMSAGASSASSARASRPLMVSGSRAKVSARRTLTPCWWKRTVRALVFVFTWSFTMPIACVSVESSSWRTLERWSHVCALSLHISESFLRYSLSSRSVASTVLRRLLSSSIPSMVSCFAFEASAIFLLCCFTVFSDSSMNVLCACTDATSSASTRVFSSVKSFSRPSRVATMSSEWNL
mmetsp:Transcript_15336/g.39537  ORF Transcript_15336/g.39537 Transcript_15336/m.39537 type:complete len:233 (-) Transcript_15336:769-1467(-)